jgi:hypothetical protein
MGNSDLSTGTFGESKCGSLNAIIFPPKCASLFCQGTASQREYAAMKISRSLLAGAGTAWRDGASMSFRSLSTAGSASTLALDPLRCLDLGRRWRSIVRKLIFDDAKLENGLALFAVAVAQGDQCFGFGRLTQRPREVTPRAIEAPPTPRALSNLAPIRRDSFAPAGFPTPPQNVDNGSGLRRWARRSIPEIPQSPA